MTFWEMSHGAGGGCDCVMNWVEFYGDKWRQAGNIVQWKKPVAEKKPAVNPFS